MAKKSSKNSASRKRKRANYKRKRRWSLENLEAKRPMAGDAAVAFEGGEVSDQPIIMSAAELTPDDEIELLDEIHECELDEELEDEVDEELDCEFGEDDELGEDFDDEDDDPDDVGDGDEDLDDVEDGDEDPDDFDDGDEDPEDVDDGGDDPVDFDDGDEDPDDFDDGDEDPDDFDDGDENPDDVDDGDQDPDDVDDGDEDPDDVDDGDEDPDDVDDGDEDPDDFDDGDEDLDDVDDGDEDPDDVDDGDEDPDDAGDVDNGGEDFGQPLPTTPMHEAVMALVTNDLATNTVTSSGNWSNPANWSNNRVPAANARIVVPQGMTLTVDSVMSQEFKTIRVDGTLNFATDRDTELRVETLVSTMMGRVEIGTAANPVQSGVSARVVFIDDGEIDRTADPQQLGRGAILHGPTTIYGSETTHRMTLAQQPRAGDINLHLSSVPTGWEVGDRIVITGTQGATSDEVRTIEAIDGRTVTLNTWLLLDHIPPKSDLSVHVANSTRNVVFTSENPEVARRGHIMFMHNQNVDVNYASFEQLGRTDKNVPLNDIFFDFAEDVPGNETSAGIVFTASGGPATNIRGRYGVHFHRGGTDPNSTPAVMNGSVVWDNPGWGFVNHSSNVDFVNNVAYGVQGVAFYTEAGDEVGTMRGNIAIRSVSPTFTLDDGGAIDPDLRAEVQDFGVDGDGYWLSGHRVSLIDNISAGASGHGMIIWSDGLVEADRGRTTVKVSEIPNGHLITDRDTIPTWWAPMEEIHNNESYGATIGFRSRYVHSHVYLGEAGSEFHEPPPQAYLDTLNPVVDGLTVWGSRDGVLLNYNERLSLRNARVIGIGAPYVQNGGTADLGVGIDMHNEVTRGSGVIENVTVEGFNMGLLAPRHDSWRFDNLDLRNTTDMVLAQPLTAPRDLEMTNINFGSLDGTAVAGNDSQRRNIVVASDDFDNGFQPYAFLMPNRITIDGQGIYANGQNANQVPYPERTEDALIQIPSQFIGRTNQQLMDRYGTSLGGAITPADARGVSYVDGGVVGSASPRVTVLPPMYDMVNEGNATVVNSGNLLNFNAPQATGREIGFGDPPNFNSSTDMSQTPATSGGQVAGVIADPIDPSTNPTTAPTPGDANSDGAVNFNDFLIVARNFGATDAAFADGDFDGDGEVGFLDFLVLARHFS